MPLPVLHVIHQRRAGTGRVGRTLKALGYANDVRCPRNGDPLPATMDKHAAAVIFGGPMSANDDTGFILDELRWLDRAVRSGRPVLGICLGAQLLTRTLGGTVGPHEHGHCEVGWHPIAPTTAGQIIFPAPMHVYQWHAEGMSLPADAELLAIGDAFPVQAWRYENVLSLQFHPEATRAAMQFWLERALQHYHGRPGAQPAPEQLTNHRRYSPAIVRWVRDVVGRWVAGHLAQ